MQKKSSFSKNFENEEYLFYGDKNILNRENTFTKKNNYIKKIKRINLNKLTLSSSTFTFI